MSFSGYRAVLIDLDGTLARAFLYVSPKVAASVIVRIDNGDGMVDFNHVAATKATAA